MAIVSQHAEQVTDLLQNFKLESQPTTGDKVPPNLNGDTSGANREPSASLGSANMPFGACNGGFDPGAYYAANGYGIPHGFYYGGYDYPVSDWNDYSQHVGIGMELQGPANEFYGIYNESGSLLYHGTNYGYMQPVYNPYSHGTHVPANNQLYAPPLYPYSSHTYPLPPGVPVVSSALPVHGNDLTSIADSKDSVVDGSNGTAPLCPRPPLHVTAVPTAGPYMRLQNTPNSATLEGSASNDGPGIRTYFDDGSRMMDGQQRQCISQPFPVNGLPGHALPTAPARMYAGPTPARGQGLMVSGFEPKGNGCGWVVADRGKPRIRNTGAFCNGNGHLDILNEQNRGPRTTRIRNQQAQPGPFWVTSSQENPNGSSDVSSTPTFKEQYNRSDFSTSYENAKFFIIKSYSEDDIHKSIKYNVWASTPNGNKKLDAAYHEAQEKAVQNPVFLFFSVNASGQFCGVAEMVGPVDFNQSMDFWQQDKWNGRFPLKWHIVKDVPNNQFRHIILANNDNKPVTNSRDTQEVVFEQGIEMLKLFKNYVFKTSILDDFQFYEDRQKAMQEKKAMQQLHAYSQQAQERSGNRTNMRSTSDEVPIKSQDVKLKIEGVRVDEHVRPKDAQSAPVSHKVALYNGGEFKLLLRPVEKGPSPAAAGTEAEHAKTCIDSKDAGIDQTKHLTEAKSSLLMDHEMKQTANPVVQCDPLLGKDL